MRHIGKSQDHSSIETIGQYPAIDLSAVSYVLAAYPPDLQVRALGAIDEVYRRLRQELIHAAPDTAIFNNDFEDGFEIFYFASADEFDVLRIWADQPSPGERLFISVVRFLDGRAPLEIPHPKTPEWVLEHREIFIGHLEESTSSLLEFLAYSIRVFDVANCARRPAHDRHDGDSMIGYARLNSLLQDDGGTFGRTLLDARLYDDGSTISHAWLRTGLHDDSGTFGGAWLDARFHDSRETICQAWLGALLYGDGGIFDRVWLDAHLNDDGSTFSRVWLDAHLHDNGGTIGHAWFGAHLHGDGNAFGLAWLNTHLHDDGGTIDHTWLNPRQYGGVAMWLDPRLHDDGRAIGHHALLNTRPYDDIRTWLNTRLHDDDDMTGPTWLLNTHCAMHDIANLLGLRQRRGHADLRQRLPNQQQRLDEAAGPLRQRAALPATTIKTAPSFMVFFDWDRCNLPVQALNRAFENKDNAPITATGCSNKSSSAVYNTALTLCRENAIEDTLLNERIPATMSIAAGKGESQSLIQAAGSLREPQNRRVEIVIQ